MYTACTIAEAVLQASGQSNGKGHYFNISHPEKHLTHFDET